MSEDTFSKFTIVPIKESNYLKPMRVEFEINKIKKYWDFLQVHESVSILIFNKTRNVLVLVKQFRPSAYICCIPNLKEGTVVDPATHPVSNGYTLELCAGIVDKNLPLEEVAREEILEECGYDVPANRLRKLFSFRNVGVTGNKSNVFYVEVEDSEKVATGGGLQSEGEFIQIIEMGVDDFRAVINSVDLNCPASFAAAGLWFLSNIKT